ncbi:hypothetical protein [Aquimarina celericrescens]|uniref:TonB-dependent receptor plug domain-containing protein n=1 Tax=Aquimarina celericrescens TaxID=1964542 RepID=A0ABW5ATF5_9FLAO
MKSIFLFSLFLFIDTLLYSQSSVIPAKANADYFDIPRESLFLHLNKSTYINGEEIWFKGYSYDRKESLPSNGSTNFNIQLFNEKGQELYKGLFFGSRGSFRGNIKIDSSWSSGSYYLKASTNWMNNFIEDESYTKKIELIKDRVIDAVVVDQALDYDFQLLPEGGHLIADTDNSIGFKLINDRGYGVSFEEGYVEDEKGKKVMSFVSNRFGMGKFGFRPVKGKRFTAVARFTNGDEVRKVFPKVEATGVAISINNMIEDEVMIELNTNKKTIGHLMGKDHYLLIRQNHLSKKLPVTFRDNETKKLISIERDNLFKGINVLTLFQDDIPILERLLMNPYDNIMKDIMISEGLTVKDSISFEVKVPQKDGVRYDISISVLPEETKSYVPNDNIYSAMLLRPYIRGFIEDEKYYFTDIDRKRKYNLDILLVTQGWSKYSWNDIFTTLPKSLYGINKGFRLKGKIQGRSKENVAKVYMHSTTFQGGQLMDIDETGAFELPNFFPEKGETIRLSGVAPDDSFVKPTLYVQTQLDQRTTFLSKEVIRKENIIENKEIHKDVEIPEGFITDQTQVLDEVDLQTNIKDENTSAIRILPHFKLNSQKITQRMADDFPTILDYIRSTGRFRIRDLAPFYSNVTIMAPVPNAINNLADVPVFLNDQELRIDLSILSIMATAEVDRVYIDRIGFGIGGIGGRGGAGASIRIYTRKTPLYQERPTANSFIEYEMKRGYEPVKEFYNPGYTNYSDAIFIDYGIIHWQPWINFSNNGTGKFMIKKTGLENITFFIEGLGSDGSLISKTITKKISPNN